MTFREYETACEQSSACSQINGLPRTRCVRECVSPSCYREIYQSDPVKHCIKTLMLFLMNCQQMSHTMIF